MVPVWYASAGREPRFWSPADQGVRLNPGDRVVVLGPSRGLQGIERGVPRPRDTRLRITDRRPYADAIALASLLVQHTASRSSRRARPWNSLPHELGEPLYRTRRTPESGAGGVGAMVELSGR